MEQFVENDILLIKISNALEYENAFLLSREIYAIIKSGVANDIIVDLQETNCIDSSGLGFIHSLKKYMIENGKTKFLIILSGINASIKLIMDHINLHSLPNFCMTNTVEEAIDLIEKNRQKIK